MKRLRHLRGDPSNENGAEVLAEVKKTLKPRKSNLERIQKHYQNGDGEGAMEIVKAIFGDLKAIKESKGMAGVKDIDWHMPLETFNSLELSEISNGQMAQFVDREFFEDLTGRMIHL